MLGEHLLRCSWALGTLYNNSIESLFVKREHPRAGGLPGGFCWIVEPCGLSSLVVARGCTADDLGAGAEYLPAEVRCSGRGKRLETPGGLVFFGVRLAPSRIVGGVNDGVKRTAASHLKCRTVCSGEATVVATACRGPCIISGAKC